MKIFHGWQAGKENRKGNDILDKAVKEAAVRVGSGKIAYVIAKNLPFDVYVKQFLDCDIFLDQIYSYD
ncbi:hypothetical protein, partial [Gulbenkiania mobilis]|uniref:hypothetical protein n=1 Tax=Gulbenkiania mobilis TaxID=397457 RepID=UPI001F470F0C